MKALVFLKKYRIFGFILILLGMITAISWTINLCFEHRLNKALKNAVFKSTNRLYTLHFEKINTHILWGATHIKKLQLCANWAVYDSLQKINKAPDNVYEINLNHVTIKGLNIYKILKNNDLSISKIQVEKPDINVYHHPLASNNGQKFHPQNEPYQIISTYLKNLTIATVELQDIHFKYIDRDSAKKSIELNHSQAHLFNWELNAQSHLDSNRFYHFEDAIFILPSYTFCSQDSLYKCHWKNIALLFKEKKITAESFEIQPIVNTSRFHEKWRLRKISIHAKFENIHLNHVDMTSFLRKKQLLAESLHIHSGFLSLKNKKEFVQKTEDNAHIIPHELLQKIQVPFVIDTVLMNHINIDYQEYSKKTNKTGEVNFGNTSFLMKNVTNMPQGSKRDNKMTIYTNTYLMNKAPFNFELSMRYDSPSGDFNMKGNVGALDGRIFNQVTIPLGLITIKSMDVEGMDFDISGHHKFLKGSMVLRYKNLSVFIMKKDEKKNLLLRKRLLSMIANKWILERQNPRTDGTLVRVPIYLERLPNFGFSKFIWKALQKGIKHSVGITPQKEISIQSNIKDFNHLKDNFQSYKEMLKKQRMLHKEQKMKKEKQP